MNTVRGLTEAGSRDSPSAGTKKWADAVTHTQRPGAIMLCRGVYPARSVILNPFTVLF